MFYNPYKPPKTTTQTRNDPVVSIKKQRPDVVEREQDEGQSPSTAANILQESEVKDTHLSLNQTSLGPQDDHGGDEDCVIVGQKGHNALADYPHSREDCVVHSIDAPTAIAWYVTYRLLNACTGRYTARQGSPTPFGGRNETARKVLETTTNQNLILIALKSNLVFVSLLRHNPYDAFPVGHPRHYDPQ
jgi:hypothetical protein